MAAERAPEVDPIAAWKEAQIARLTPDLRRSYENDPEFRSFVHLCLEDQDFVRNATAAQAAA